MFPLGDLLKPEVRVLADKYGLPTARKKDSQGICFIGQVKMSDFLRHYLPDKPGKIVDTEGKTLGSHNGLHLFTMGQRKGPRRRLPAGRNRLRGGGKGRQTQPFDPGV